MLQVLEHVMLRDGFGRIIFLSYMGVAAALQIVLAWNRLPCRNAQVAVYSDVLTFLFGCNNDPVHLGTSAAAKAAMFYLVKYITQDSVALNTALSILKDAKKHVDKWKSTAEDATTNPHRPSIQLTERVTNCNGGMELADTQMAGVDDGADPGNLGCPHSARGSPLTRVRRASKSHGMSRRQNFRWHWLSGGRGGSTPSAQSAFVCFHFCTNSANASSVTSANSGGMMSSVEDAVPRFPAFRFGPACKVGRAAPRMPARAARASVPSLLSALLILHKDRLPTWVGAVVIVVAVVLRLLRLLRSRSAGPRALAAAPSGRGGERGGRPVDDPTRKRLEGLQGDAGAGDAASVAATRLCVVAAPAASLLRQRAAACAEMSGREVALVSFGSPTSPASGYGQGRSGPEEELCRLMPAFHGQLTASAAYPLGSGAALVTKTLLSRESGNYAPIHPAVTVTVISTHLGASDSRRGGTAEWHAALRIGAQTALWAAQRSQITDLVLCGEAFGADPALATEGMASFCDVLRSQEFAGAFRTVVLGVCRENEGLASAHLATIDHRSSTGERVPSTAESAELAAELERHLREWRGWTEHAGEPIDIAELAGAMGPIVGWACDATRLAVAAQVLQTAGKLSLSEANGSNTSTKTVERGQPSDIPGIGWGVESYAPAQANALPRGPSSRCCLILSDVPPCLGSFRTTACHWEAHTEGVAGMALREATRLRHVQNLRVAILIAGNAGRPGGACRGPSGQHEPAKLHAGHNTQEEDLVSNWLLCLPEAERRQAFGRITKAWGLTDPSGLSNSTVQGVDYTSAGAPPRIYADA
mmetsp:Transcript_9110/g.21562  ORF Transcript_9110/g.21562 Transcript_9110/m.21562 type:complete len:818 (+) Transcript_9110:275-2728(+)